MPLERRVALSVLITAFAAECQDGLRYYPSMLVVAHVLHAYRPADLLRDEGGIPVGVIGAVVAVAAGAFEKGQPPITPPKRRWRGAFRFHLR